MNRFLFVFGEFLLKKIWGWAGTQRSIQPSLLASCFLPSHPSPLDHANSFYGRKKEKNETNALISKLSLAVATFCLLHPMGWLIKFVYHIIWEDGGKLTDKERELLGLSKSSERWLPPKPAKKKNSSGNPQSKASPEKRLVGPDRRATGAAGARTPTNLNWRQVQAQKNANSFDYNVRYSSPAHTSKALLPGLSPLLPKLQQTALLTLGVLCL